MKCRGRVVISHVILKDCYQIIWKNDLNWFKIDFNVFSGENFDFNVNKKLNLIEFDWSF